MRTVHALPDNERGAHHQLHRRWHLITWNIIAPLVSRCHAACTCGASCMRSWAMRPGMPVVCVPKHGGLCRTDLVRTARRRLAPCRDLLRAHSRSAPG
eukprot:6228009-Prymnesium_polylepis.3